MSRTQKTILIFVFAALSLWRLFEIPAVANAFWAFCTVGALPGTDQIVPPKLMLKLLIMVFPLSLLIIFRKEFLAAVPHRQFASAIELLPTPKSEPVADKRKPKSPVVIVLPVKVRTPIGVHLKRASRMLGKALDTAAEVIVNYELKGAKVIYRAVRALVILLGNGLVALGSVTIALGRLAMWLWHLAEPYIRQFDHWLDVMLHRSRTVSLMLDVGSEGGRMVAGGVQKLHAFTYSKRR